MNLTVHTDSHLATDAAANLLAEWFAQEGTCTVMLAAGNTPLALYRGLGNRGLSLSHLEIFALDEYVGVPLEEPLNCANTLRQAAVDSWGVPEEQFHFVSSLKGEALASVQNHERRIESAGGLDVIVLGLGQNGHLGFNEPGSMEDSPARMLDLDPISVEANRKWFQDKYAPEQGATIGMTTILSAKRILIMAFGSHKTTAVRAMLEGPRTTACPASLLQGHPEVHVFIDLDAASGLSSIA